MITEKQYKEVADLIGCEIATVKAVAKVESNGSGFNKDGSPKILFEGHWFYRLTDGKYGNNSFSYPKWIRTYYNMDQHKRLADAVAKDRDAALQSASWGAFQIMGFNYKKCGFKDIQSFINAMYKDDAAHLMAFAHYIKSVGLDDELRNKQWARFAYQYNGSGYRSNKYDTKLQQAYDSYK